MIPTDDPPTPDGQPPVDPALDPCTTGMADPEYIDGPPLTPPPMFPREYADPETDVARPPGRVIHLPSVITQTQRGTILAAAAWIERIYNHKEMLPASFLADIDLAPLVKKLRDLLAATDPRTPPDARPAAADDSHPMLDHEHVNGRTNAPEDLTKWGQPEEEYWAEREARRVRKAATAAEDWFVISKSLRKELDQAKEDVEKFKKLAGRTDSIVQLENEIKRLRTENERLSQPPLSPPNIVIQNLRQALQVAVNALNGVKGHAQYCDNCKSFEMVNDCLQAHHGFTHELDGPHWDVNSQVERAYKELEAWHSLRDVSTHFVPGNDGMGEEIDPTPASVRDHLKYLQTEWDDAEKHHRRRPRDC